MPRVLGGSQGGGRARVRSQLIEIVLPEHLGLTSNIQISPVTFGVYSVGFRVQGSGFGVQGSGFGVRGSGFRVQGAGFRVQSSPAPGFEASCSKSSCRKPATLRVYSVGFRVQGSGFRVQGSEFRVQGLGFRVQGVGCMGQLLKIVLPDASNIS